VIKYIMPEYLLILIGLFLVTVFLHWYFKVKIFRSTVHMLVLTLLILIEATIWDQFAIWRGHWSFNPRYLVGIKIGYMPIEEFLFALIVPYHGLTVFRILEKRLKK